MIKKLKAIDFIYFFLIISALIIHFSFYPLNVDSTWILHCGKEMSNGSTMYKDMIDVNPPLIFIYAAITAFFSKTITLPTDITFILFTLLLICISIFFSWKILEKVDFSNKNSLRFYLYGVIFIETILVSYNFTEREHLFIIFILPYVLMRIYSNEIENLSFLFRVFIAVFATLGFNLKPHFFLIFILIELFCFIKEKRLSYFLKVDFIIILSSLIIYFFIVYTFFPLYVNFMIPFAVETYTNVFNKSIPFLLMHYEIVLLILVLILFLLLSKKSSFEKTTILIAIFSSVIIYLIQQKGWSYHRIPLLSFTLLFIIHLIFYENNRSTLFFFLIPFVIIIPFENLKNHNTNLNSLREITKNLPDKSSIHIISTDIAQGQPLLKKNQIWASRFSAYFMLPSMIRNKNGDFNNYTFNATYEDLLKYKPDFILFPSGKNNFNYYSFFTSNSDKLNKIYKNFYKITYEKDYLVLKKIKDYK